MLTAEAQASRIAAIKQEARRSGSDLVLNARVDVFLHAVGAPETRLDEAVRRGKLYLEAGADCVFPIFLGDEAMIRALVDRLKAPINVLVKRDAPSLARLRELGVARATFGSGIHRVAMDLVTVLAGEMAKGDCTRLT